jgi:hypothetical protein
MSCATRRKAPRASRPKHRSTRPVSVREETTQKISARRSDPAGVLLFSVDRASRRAGRGAGRPGRAGAPSAAGGRRPGRRRGRWGPARTHSPWRLQPDDAGDLGRGQVDGSPDKQRLQGASGGGQQRRRAHDVEEFEHDGRGGQLWRHGGELGVPCRRAKSGRRSRHRGGRQDRPRPRRGRAPEARQGAGEAVEGLDEAVAGGGLNPVQQLKIVGGVDPPSSAVPVTRAWRRLTPAIIASACDRAA